MFKSIEDVIDGYLDRKNLRARKARLLRARAWWSKAVAVSGLSPTKFARERVDKGDSKSNLELKWKAGTLPNLTTVERVSHGLSGVLEVFKHPLFVLLEDRPMTKREVRSIVHPFLVHRNGISTWEFPNDKELQDRLYWTPPSSETDTYQLLMRGDLWGFMALVGLVRDAEAKIEVEQHVIFAKDMVRAIPAAAQFHEDWLRPHASLLCECVDALCKRMPMTRVAFNVDWKLIARQVDDPDMEPIHGSRLKSRRDLSGSWPLYQDPIQDSALS